MIGSKKLSKQNRQKTEQLCLSLVCRAQNLLCWVGLTGTVLERSSLMMRTMKPQCLRKEGRERELPFSGRNILGPQSQVDYKSSAASGRQPKRDLMPKGWKKRGGVQGSSEQAAVLSESQLAMVIVSLHQSSVCVAGAAGTVGTEPSDQHSDSQNGHLSNPFVQQHRGCWRGGLVCEQVFVP